MNESLCTCGHLPHIFSCWGDNGECACREHADAAVQKVDGLPIPAYSHFWVMETQINWLEAELNKVRAANALRVKLIVQQEAVLRDAYSYVEEAVHNKKLFTQRVKARGVLREIDAALAASSESPTRG